MLLPHSFTFPFPITPFADLTFHTWGAFLRPLFRLSRWPFAPAFLPVQYLMLSWHISPLPLSSPFYSHLLPLHLKIPQFWVFIIASLSTGVILLLVAFAIFARASMPMSHLDSHPSSPSLSQPELPFSPLTRPLGLHFLPVSLF